MSLNFSDEFDSVAKRSIVIAEAALCYPTFTTYLFAYSNDMDPAEVRDALRHFSLDSIVAQFPWIVDVRFDVQSSSAFYFHRNWEDFNASVYDHLPDPALGYSSSNTGSDVIRMLELYLQQTEYPICGTRATVLMRRYSNETDITNIVEKLQKYHTSLTIVSPTPEINSGGLHPETMYQVATKTNGFCIFEERCFQYFSVLPPDSYIYLFYAANVQVSGNSSVSLPQLIVNDRQLFWFTITVQDHGPVDNFLWTRLTWESHTGKDNFCVWDNSDTEGSFVMRGLYLFDPDTYTMKLDYKYSNQKTQMLQVRVGTNTPVDFWAPFDN